jgi:hypothetical protein
MVRQLPRGHHRHRRKRHHQPAAQEKLRSLYQNPEPNVYTTEKNGQKKLIYQTPVYEDGVLIGVVELSLPLPAEVPHFKRD